MDPELRSFLEAMEQRLIRHADERLAAAGEEAMLLTRVQSAITVLVLVLVQRQHQ